MELFRASHFTRFFFCFMTDGSRELGFCLNLKLTIQRDFFVVSFVLTLVPKKERIAQRWVRREVSRFSSESQVYIYEARQNRGPEVEWKCSKTCDSLESKENEYEIVKYLVQFMNWRREKGRTSYLRTKQLVIWNVYLGYQFKPMR